LSVIRLVFGHLFGSSSPSRLEATTAKAIPGGLRSSLGVVRVVPRTPTISLGLFHSAPPLPNDKSSRSRHFPPTPCPKSGSTAPTGPHGPHAPAASPNRTAQLATTCWPPTGRSGGTQPFERFAPRRLAGAECGLKHSGSGKTRAAGAARPPAASAPRCGDRGLIWPRHTRPFVCGPAAPGRAESPRPVILFHRKGARVGRAFDHSSPVGMDLLLIENVGNLVCPTEPLIWATAAAVAALVTEGRLNRSNTRPCSNPPILVVINKSISPEAGGLRSRRGPAPTWPGLATAGADLRVSAAVASAFDA